MLRDLHHIPLDQLTVSKLNVRKHGAKDVASLAASVAALGMLQPLLVRAKDDGFEIVVEAHQDAGLPPAGSEGGGATLDGGCTGGMTGICGCTGAAAGGG